MYSQADAQVLCWTQDCTEFKVDSGSIQSLTLDVVHGDQVVLVVVIGFGVVVFIVHVYCLQPYGETQIENIVEVKTS